MKGRKFHCRECGQGPYKSPAEVRSHRLIAHSNEAKGVPPSNGVGGSKPKTLKRFERLKEEKGHIRTKEESPGLDFCPCCGTNLRLLRRALEAVQEVQEVVDAR